MKRLVFSLLAMALASAAFATNKNTRDVEQDQGQAQGQEQAQAQEAKAYSDSVSESESVSSASASNDGNSLTVEGDRVENNSSNVVLVPNNNTESCVRVFGLAFGKNGESGALGVPWRSKSCDFEQAADDAFAAGERDLGWFWKCQNKNLYRTFKDEGETNAKAIEDCHTRMLSTTSTDEIVEKLERQLQAADEQIDLLRRHQKVCEESKGRCEEKLYGAK